MILPLINGNFFHISIPLRTVDHIPTVALLRPEGLAIVFCVLMCRFTVQGYDLFFLVKLEVNEFVTQKFAFLIAQYLAMSMD